MLMSEIPQEGLKARIRIVLRQLTISKSMDNTLFEMIVVTTAEKMLDDLKKLNSLSDGVILSYVEI